MKCIFCETEENVTSINIKYEGKNVVVYICELHSEESTLKDIRDAYGEKQSKIDQMIKELESLGYKVAAPGEIMQISQPQPPQQPQPQVVPKAPQIIQNPHEVKQLNEWASQGISEDTEHMPNAQIEDVSIPAPTGAYKLPNIKKEIQKDKGGSKATIKDAMGTTQVQIVSGASNDQLQKRTKDLSDDPHAIMKPPSECTACSGSGFAINGQACPRCGGTGSVMR
jgi:hypothetical protein